MNALLISFLILTQPGENLSLPEASEFSIVANEQSGDVLELDVVDLAEDSMLRIEDFQSVRIKKLVAKEGARIQLASPNSGLPAGPSVDGVSGAEGVFFIDTIDGHVLIEARGGHGGSGLAGRPGQQGVRGAKGRDARKLFWFIYLGRGDHGYPGGRGLDGSDGGDGGDGGSGGHVQVYYREKNPESRIVVDVSGGQGGRAGKGGRAGLGGMGGPGGKGWPSGRQGRMGSPGNNGKSGRPGMPGKSGRVEIYQIDKKLFSCLLFVHLTEQEINEGEWSQCVGS